MSITDNDDVPIRRASDVARWVAARVATISSASSKSKKLVESTYRLALAEEPDAALDGRFYVDVSAIKGPAEMRHHGRREMTWQAQVIVEVGYYVGGGRDGRGSLQAVANRGADDGMVIADVVENPAFYDSARTGIRRAIFDPGGGAKRIASQDNFEVWATAFIVEWRSRRLDE